MSRPWGKQYAHMLNHPKYLRATVEERSAWHSLFLVALNSPREDLLGSRDEVVAILANLGHGAAAGERLDGLIRLRLVDVRRSQHRIHGWSDWQPDDPTGAKRKAANRAQKVTGQSADGHGTVTGMSAAGHALDGDGDREEIPHPLTPAPRRGQSPNGSQPRTEAGRRALQYRETTDDDLVDAGSFAEAPVP